MFRRKAEKRIVELSHDEVRLMRGNDKYRLLSRLI